MFGSGRVAAGRARTMCVGHAQVLDQLPAEIRKFIFLFSFNFSLNLNFENLYLNIQSSKIMKPVPLNS
jgi:hypothetical protein